MARRRGWRGWGTSGWGLDLHHDRSFCCKGEAVAGPAHCTRLAPVHRPPRHAVRLAHQEAQIDEMVGASISHPSVLMHGFFNEGPSSDPRACPAYAASAAAIRRQVPPSHRLVTWATSAKEKVKHAVRPTASLHGRRSAMPPCYIL